MPSRSLRCLLAGAAVLALAALQPAAASAGDEPLRRVQVHRLMHPGHGFDGPGAFLGVGFLPLTPELRQHYGVAADLGVLVSKVVEDSPAAKAGVEVGDVLTRVDGEGVEEVFDLGRLIGRKEAGATVNLEVYRDGRAQALSATLSEPPEGMRKRHHAAHAAHAAHAEMLETECEGGPEDCPLLDKIRPDCPEGEATCEVKVVCKDGDCTCTVNGKEAACGD